MSYGATTFENLYEMTWNGSCFSNEVKLEEKWCGWFGGRCFDEMLVVTVYLLAPCVFASLPPLISRSLLWVSHFLTDAVTSVLLGAELRWLPWVSNDDKAHGRLVHEQLCRLLGG